MNTRIASGGLYPASFVTEGGGTVYAVLASHGTTDPMQAATLARSANMAGDLAPALMALTNEAVLVLTGQRTDAGTGAVSFAALQDAAIQAVELLRTFGALPPQEAPQIPVPPFNRVCRLDDPGTPRADGYRDDGTKGPLRPFGQTHQGCGARFWSDDPRAVLCPRCVAAAATP